MIFDIRFKLKRHQVELDTLLFNEFDSSCLQHGNFSYQFVQQPSCDKFVEFQDFRSFRRIMKWPTSDIVFPWRTQVLVFHEFDIVSNLSNIAATLTFGADVFEWPPIVWSTVVLQATIRFQCAVLLISSSNIYSFWKISISYQKNTAVSNENMSEISIRKQNCRCWESTSRDAWFFNDLFVDFKHKSYNISHSNVWEYEYITKKNGIVPVPQNSVPL